MTKKVAAVAPGLALLMTAVAAMAWACTSQPFIQVDPQADLPPAQATVSGTGFLAQPVQIMWNSNSGPVLAETNGPNFSVRIRVPDVPPGVYSIVAGQGPASIAAKAAASFQVLEPEKTSAPVTTSRSTSGSSSGAPLGPAAGPAPGGSSNRVYVPVISAGNAAAPESGASGGTEVAPSVEPGGSRVLLPRPEVVPAALPGARSMAVPSVQGAASLPSRSLARSVADDLWEGFASSRFHAGPVTTSLLVGGRGTSAAAPGLTAMITLLAVGLVALSSGFGLAEIRRRKPRLAARRGR